MINLSKQSLNVRFKNSISTLIGDESKFLFHLSLLLLMNAIFFIQSTFAELTALKVGSEIQVNTVTVNTQESPDVAMDSNGNFVIVWVSNLQDGDSGGIFAQRFDNTGAKVGSEFQVNTYTTGIQTAPSVAMDSNGDFVVVWSSENQDGDSSGVYAQRYNNNGVAQGSEFLVNTNTTGSQQNPRIAMDVNGNFVIVWTDISNNTLRFQRYDSSGLPQGSETSIASGSQPDIAIDSSGNFVITWDGGISAQRFNSTGIAQGSSFMVNTTTAGAEFSPRVSMDTTGNFTITWSSASIDGDNWGIGAQRFDNVGTAIGPELIPNLNTYGPQRLSDVSMDPSGNAVVVWQEENFSSDGIRARFYDNVGLVQGTEKSINGNGFDQTRPSIAFSQNNQFVIVWQSWLQDGDSSGIYAQLYDKLNHPPVLNPIPNQTIFEESSNNNYVLTFSDVETPANLLTFSVSVIDNTFQPTTDVSVIVSGTGNSRTISVTPQPNIIGQYAVIPSVQDADGRSDTEFITFTIEPISDDPPTAFDATYNIPENSTNGASVGIAAATDPDPMDTLTFSIIGGNTNNVFAINANTGEITINDSSQLDAQTIPVYNLTVLVTDDGPGPQSDTATITVNINAALSIEFDHQLYSKYFGFAPDIDANLGDQFGASVAIEGDIAVVAAHAIDFFGTSRGAAYVFERISGCWIMIAKLMNSDTDGIQSIAISGDTIVVGKRDVYVYVYEKPAGGWADMSETAILTSSDHLNADWFGSAVDISGNTIVVGAHKANGNNGKAYVFEKPGGGWANMTESQILTASDASSSAQFGIDVAIDNNVIVIGSPLANTFQGAAYVFEKPGASWVETAILTASDAAVLDWFGEYLSISGDTIAVGSYLSEVSGVSDAGAVYVYEKPGGGWSTATETAKLVASNLIADDELGGDISIDGNTIAAGANNHTYVFEKPGGGWVNGTESGLLTPYSAGQNDEFGISVAVSGNTILEGNTNDRINIYDKPGVNWANMNPSLQFSIEISTGDKLGTAIDVDGNIAVIGIPLDGISFDIGLAIVFEKVAGIWVPKAKLTPSDLSTDDMFGTDVSISGDTIIVGSPGDDESATNTGSIYVFVKPANGWTSMTDTAKLSLQNPEIFDNLGEAISIDGNTIAAGVRMKNSAIGAVYVFEKPGGGWISMTETAELTAFDGLAGDGLGISVDIEGDTIVAGATGDDTGAIQDTGTTYVFEKPGGGWVNTSTFAAKLTTTDAANLDYFGYSVSISSDVIVVGAPKLATSFPGISAAYLYEKPGGGWTSMTETAKLTASDGAISDHFGFSVSISGDKVVVGSREDDDGVTDSGSIYFFTKPGSGWSNATETRKFTASDASSNDWFGNTVALKESSLLVGAPQDDDKGTDAGAIYTYSLNSSPTDITLSANTIDENSSIGTVISTLSTIDPDTGDSHSYSFNSNPGNLFLIDVDQLKVNGILNYESAINHNISIRSTDSGGVAIDKPLTIFVNDINDDPFVANPIPDQNAPETQLFTFTFNTNTFDDDDAGDTLTYSAQLNGGGSLPGWLSFTPATFTFFGTPFFADIGTVSIDVVADDGNSGTSIDTFDIVVSAAPQTDSDGINDFIENNALNSGDGNNDGTLDSQQPNVASLPNASDGQYITMVVPSSQNIVNVSAIPNPSPGDAPAISFPIGFFSFSIDNIVPAGSATTMTIIAPPGTSFSTYYKYGKTPSNPVDHWYEFLFDGTTGAVIAGNTVTLHFVDGLRGDDDLTANGIIVDDGAPGNNPTPTFSLLHPSSGIDCDSVREYTVVISDASAVVGYRVAVNFDPNKATYVPASADVLGTSAAADFDSLTVNATTPGQLIFTNASSGTALGEGEASLLKFSLDFKNTVIEGEEHTISFLPITNLNDGAIVSDTVDLIETVNPVNDQPTFSIPNPFVQRLEDEGPQSIAGFAANINPGDAGESGQQLTFSLAVDNESLFVATPTISANGTLTFTSAPNAFGITGATVYLMDDGGVANCGIDTSTAAFFTIEILPVNDAPTFTLGSDQFINEDDPAQTVIGFATGISVGPVNEATQSYLFLTSTNNNILFSATPVIDVTGTLTYTPAPNANGSALVTVVMQDDGGTANGGVDSSTQTFNITIFAVNDEPTIDPVPIQFILEDSGLSLVNLSGISDGDPELDQPLTENLIYTNPGLIASASIIVPASSATGTIQITPALNEFGSSVFTLTLQDNGSNVFPNDNTVNASFVVNVSPVNDAPSFIKGASQNILNVTGGTRTVVNWTSGITAGPTNEANQLLNFSVETDQPGLFAVAPAVTPDGTLTFTPAPNAHGIVNVSLSINDDGGTDFGGINASATDSFTITKYTQFLWGDLNIDNVSGTVDASLILRFDAALLPTVNTFGESFQEFPGYPIVDYPEYFQPRAGVLPFPASSTFPLAFPPAANVAGNDNEAGVLDAAQLLRVAALLDDFVQSDSNFDGIGPDQPIFLTKQASRSQVIPRSLLVDLSAERSSTVSNAFTAWNMNFFVDNGDDLSGFRIALEYDPAVVDVDDFGVEALSGAVIVVNDTQPGRLIVSGALIEIPGAGSAELLSVRMVSTSSADMLIDSIRVDVDESLTRLNDGALQLSAQSVGEVLLSETTDVLDWMILE